MLTENSGFHVAVECRHHMHSGTCFDLIFRRCCDCGLWISHGIPIFIEMCMGPNGFISELYSLLIFFLSSFFMRARRGGGCNSIHEQIEILLKFLSAFFALSFALQFDLPTAKSNDIPSFDVIFMLGRPRFLEAPLKQPSVAIKPNQTNTHTFVPRYRANFIRIFCSVAHSVLLLLL